MKNSEEAIKNTHVEQLSVEAIFLCLKVLLLARWAFQKVAFACVSLFFARVACLFICICEETSAVSTAGAVSLC